MERIWQQQLRETTNVPMTKVRCVHCKMVFASIKKVAVDLDHRLCFPVMCGLSCEDEMFVNATISTCWMEGEVKDDAGFAYLIKCPVPNFCGLNDCDPGVLVGYTRVGKVPAGSKFAEHLRKCEEDPTLDFLRSARIGSRAQFYCDCRHVPVCGEKDHAFFGLFCFMLVTLFCRFTVGTTSRSRSQCWKNF
jgi:hypothetical protein